MLVLSAAFGCGKAAQNTLGAPPAVQASMTALTASRAKQGERCTLHGEMIDKCPTAGCWFVLKDKSGTIHVDTKSAGFVVTSVPTHTEITVTGVLQAEPGQPSTLSATGVRY
jgi:uncharacterized protein YdeI (BOF family)